MGNAIPTDGSSTIQQQQIQHPHQTFPNSRQYSYPIDPGRPQTNIPHSQSGGNLSQSGNLSANQASGSFGSFFSDSRWMYPPPNGGNFPHGHSVEVGQNQNIVQSNSSRPQGPVLDPMLSGNFAAASSHTPQSHHSSAIAYQSQQQQQFHQFQAQFAGHSGLNQQNSTAVSMNTHSTPYNTGFR
jgi:hypothetical protein